MPVRFLSSSILVWPKPPEVLRILSAWTGQVRRMHPEVVRVGYFGSLARGDWGVGSDVDLVILVRESVTPFAQRPAAFDTLGLPVPADLLVYTVAEYRDLVKRGDRFARVLRDEVVWLDPVAHPAGSA